MRYLFSLVLALLCARIFALEIIDARGANYEYSYAEFFKVKAEELKISENESWLGIRFDNWMKGQNLGEFKRIRFISKASYELSFDKADWDTLSCWLVYEKNGQRLANEELGIVFPYLKRGGRLSQLKRVILEDLHSLRFPGKFYFLENLLAAEQKTVINTILGEREGYELNNLAYSFGEEPLKVFHFYTREGLHFSLKYPAESAGVFLEKDETGKLNLLGANLPEVNWQKDIIYVQCGEIAAVERMAMAFILSLAKVQYWPITMNSMLKFIGPGYVREYLFEDCLRESDLNSNAWYFQVSRRG